MNTGLGEFPKVRGAAEGIQGRDASGYSRRQLGAKSSKTSLFILLGLLATLQSAEGKLYNTTRLEPAEHYYSKDLVACLRSLGDDPPVIVTARLIVQSTANVNEFIAGDATLSQELSDSEWYNITIDHTTSDYEHGLDVTCDGRSVDFNKQPKMWTTSYRFKEILILTKGLVEMTNCSHPEDPITAAPTEMLTQMVTVVTPNKQGSPVKTTNIVASSTKSSFPESSEKPPTSSPMTKDGSNPLSTTKAVEKDEIRLPSTTKAATLDVVVGGSSWIWALGAIGSVPALLLIIGLVGFMSIVCILSACIHLCLRKNDTTRSKDSRADYNSVRSNSRPTENSFTTHNEITFQQNQNPYQNEEEEQNGRYSGGNMETFRDKGYQVPDYN